MSDSPNNVPDETEKQSVDELAEGHTADDAEPADSSGQPIKRGRGRPKGSKNKKATTAGAESSTAPAVPRKRGRPPKEKKEDEGQPAPKRPRGRPPKHPKPAPAEGAASGEEDEPPVKKKRGRPPKKPAAA